MIYDLFDMIYFLDMFWTCCGQITQLKHVFTWTWFIFRIFVRNLSKKYILDFGFEIRSLARYLYFWWNIKGERENSRHWWTGHHWTDLKWLQKLYAFVHASKKIESVLLPKVMYQSNWRFNIPPPGNPQGIWTFEDWLVQIPSPRGKKAVQMPHPLVLKYLSSKGNFLFNQTLFTLFRERYAVMTPLTLSVVSNFRRSLRVASPRNLARARVYFARPTIAIAKIRGYSQSILRALFTNKGEILSWKSVKPWKNRKNSQAYFARTRGKSSSNSPPF